MLLFNVSLLPSASVSRTATAAATAASPATATSSPDTALACCHARQNAASPGRSLAVIAAHVPASLFHALPEAHARAEKVSDEARKPRE